MRPVVSSPALSVTEIILSIENLLACAGPYEFWTIGIARDIQQARSSRDSSGLWNDWLADADASARRARDHFTQRGMMLDPASDEEGRYVYIF